jgi:hypothetical protein
VLEDAYRLDPKPDKAARQEIVKSVALGEKEVQVSGSCLYGTVIRTNHV